MNYTKLDWRDGQPYSERFDDIYCSSHYSGAGEDGRYQGGEGEFMHVFFEGNRLGQRWRGVPDERASSGFCIAELGFGSGLNFLLTARQWLNERQLHDATRQLHYIAIERYPLSPDDIRQILRSYPQLDELTEELLLGYPPAVKGNHVRYLFDGRIRVCFCFMDAAEALRGRRFAVDAWYLDGFSPSRNTSMWSAALLDSVAANSRDGASFATYTAAGEVRRNLQAAGFSVDRVKGYGNKREMLRGELTRDRAITESTAPARSGFLHKEKPWYQPLAPSHATDGPVTVIGAGVAGLCVAEALCRRGRQVTLIDRLPAISMSTSSNPAAVVYPRLSVGDHEANTFYTDAFSLAVSFLDGLQADYPDRQFWFQTGLLQAMDAERLDKVLGLELYCEQWLARAVVEDSTHALIPRAGYVLPPVLAEALRHRCGDRLRFVQADIDLVCHSDGLWHCSAAGEPVSSSPVLVLATNTGFRAIEDDDLSWLEIDRVGGQSISVASDEKSEAMIDRVLNRGRYITPAHGGVHHVGASYRADTGEPDEAIIRMKSTETDELLAAFRSVVKTAEDRQVLSQWAGVRGVARDRMPIIGPCADRTQFARQYSETVKGDARRRYPPAAYRQGLYLSQAHGSRGFTTAYLAAEIIASGICAEPIPVGVDVLQRISTNRMLIRYVTGC